MILVRFHGYPGEVRELWLSRVPAMGETLRVDDARREVTHVEWDLTEVQVTSSGAAVGLRVDVSLGEPSARSWAPKRFESPPALS